MYTHAHMAYTQLYVQLQYQMHGKPKVATSNCNMDTNKQQTAQNNKHTKNGNMKNPVLAARTKLRSMYQSLVFQMRNLVPTLLSRPTAAFRHKIKMHTFR